MNTKIILLLIFILNFSCKQEKVSDISHFVINTSFTEKDRIKLSDFVESIDIISLETNQDCLVESVGKLVKYNDFYYIASTTNVINKILIFDKNGKFIYKLDKKGSGPNEYIDIRDFDVIDNDKIVIISRSNPGIYIYDIHKDSCILHKNIDIYPNNILTEENYFYIMNDGTKFHRETNDLIFKYDKQANYINSFFKVEQETLNIISNVAPLVSLSLYNKDIYFNYPFCNTVYKIEDTDISTEYELDFGGKFLPVNELKGAKDILEIEKHIKKNKGLNSLIYYAINSHFSLFTFYDYQLYGYILLHNKNENRSLIAHEIIDDLYFKGNKIKLKPWKLPKLLKDNVIHYHMEPGELITFLQDYKKRFSSDNWQIFCNDHPQLIEKISKMKEDDNPILLSIKLK